MAKSKKILIVILTLIASTLFTNISSGKCVVYSHTEFKLVKFYMTYLFETIFETGDSILLDEIAKKDFKIIFWGTFESNNKYQIIDRHSTFKLSESLDSCKLNDLMNQVENLINTQDTLYLPYFGNIRADGWIIPCKLKVFKQYWENRDSVKYPDIHSYVRHWIDSIRTVSVPDAEIVICD